MEYVTLSVFSSSASLFLLLSVSYTDNFAAFLIYPNPTRFHLKPYLNYVCKTLITNKLIVSSNYR